MSLSHAAQVQKERSEEWAGQVAYLARTYVAPEAVIVRSATTAEDYAGADYLLQLPHPGGCGVRVRYNCPFRDLTIRVVGPNGGDSEYHRMVRAQHPAHYIYLWVTDNHVDDWAVYDMRVVYAANMLDGLLARERRNPDGTSFTYLRHRDLTDAGAVIATTIGGKL